MAIVIPAAGIARIWKITVQNRVDAGKQVSKYSLTLLKMFTTAIDSISRPVTHTYNSTGFFLSLIKGHPTLNLHEN
jgi:hypothetical protein